MYAFTIGTTALAAGTRAMDLVGQNIANASTPGYHRQAVNLVSLDVGGTNGVGVGVGTITRFAAPPLRTAILRGTADQSALTARLDARQQVEAALAPGTGGIDGRLEDFFNQVEQLTTRPDDTALRRTALASADGLAKQFNAAAGDIDRLRADLGQQAGQAVAEVNDLAAQVADLNARIAPIETRGEQANDLRDRRDQLVQQIAERIDVRAVEQPDGTVNLLAPGRPVVVGNFATRFQVGPDAAGNLAVTEAGTTDAVRVSGGRLGGLLQEYNHDIPATRGRLDNLAREVVRRVDQIQATGLGTAGPLTDLRGTRGVADPATPLVAQNLPIAPRAGPLTVSVTDAAGTRTDSAIAIDPATQSLTDVAAAITAGTGGQVQASVDAATNALRFQAQSGFRFDFAGSGGSDPDTAGILPALGVNGVFTGTDAASLAVRPDLLADPGLLAGSRTGQPGDGTNFERLAALRDQPLFAGSRTLAGEALDIASGVGADVKQLGDQQSAQDGVLQNLNAQEQAVAGVDINEELVHLLDYQRMVQSASRYLSVVNSALDEMMNIVR